MRSLLFGMVAFLVPVQAAAAGALGPPRLIRISATYRYVADIRISRGGPRAPAAAACTGTRKATIPKSKDRISLERRVISRRDALVTRRAPPQHPQGT